MNHIIISVRALTRYIVHCVWFATLCFAFVWEYSVCATHFKSCQSLHELAGLLCEFVMLCLNNLYILNGIIHLLIL